MTRLYLPLTLDLLRAAHAEGRLTPGADVVVAEDDTEEAEYAALMTAADASAERVAGAGRRVVLVAEVPDAADLAHPVPWKRVVALHADAADRPAGADPDEDLAWYATQEIPDLLRTLP